MREVHNQVNILHFQYAFIIVYECMLLLFHVMTLASSASEQDP